MATLFFVNFGAIFTHELIKLSPRNLAHRLINAIAQKLIKLLTPNFAVFTAVDFHNSLRKMDIAHSLLNLCLIQAVDFLSLLLKPKISTQNVIDTYAYEVLRSTDGTTLALLQCSWGNPLKAKNKPVDKHVARLLIHLLVGFDPIIMIKISFFILLFEQQIPFLSTHFINWSQNTDPLIAMRLRTFQN